MPRTTAEAVAKLVEVDTKAVPSLDPFIELANLLTTNVCGSAGYDDATMEAIERLLSAHFYCIRDPRRAYESVRNVAETVQWKVDLGLAQSGHGQQAMILDYKGLLAKVNARSVKGYLGPTTISLKATRGGDGTD